MCICSTKVRVDPLCGEPLKKQLDETVVFLELEKSVSTFNCKGEFEDWRDVQEDLKKKGRLEDLENTKNFGTFAKHPVTKANVVWMPKLSLDLQNQTASLLNTELLLVAPLHEPTDSVQSWELLDLACNAVSLQTLAYRASLCNT